MDRKKTIDWMVGIHKELWARTDYVPDLQARMSGTNTLFIEMMKRVRTMEDVPKDAAEPQPVTPEAPKVVEPPIESPKTSPAAPEPPAKVIEPEKPLVLPPTDPSVIKEAPGVKPPEPPKHQTFDVTPEEAANSKTLPEYDRTNLVWNFCSKHPAANINFISERSGKKYQKCEECHDYLNADGKRAPYDPATGIPVKVDQGIPKVPYKKTIIKGGSK